jgi:hypothetical protein
MKENVMLTVASLLTILGLSLHVTHDIVLGMEKADFSNFYLVFYLLIMLYGTLMLPGRRLGYIIMLITGLFGLGMPFLHMRGAHYAEHVAGSGGFFFVWTLFAVGVTGVFTAILSARGLWGTRRGQWQ